MVNQCSLAVAILVLRRCAFNSVKWRRLVSIELCGIRAEEWDASVNDCTLFLKSFKFEATLAA